MSKNKLLKYELTIDEVHEIHHVLGLKEYRLKEAIELYEKIGGEITAYIDDLKKELKLIKEIDDKLLHGF